jgi:hypothetical protein
MIKINKIFKERLTDKLSRKNRYYNKSYYNRYFKFIFTLDNINYCLYDSYFTIFWYKNGKKHRDYNGLPACIYHDGSKFYFKEYNMITKKQIKLL